MANSATPNTPARNSTASPTAGHWRKLVQINGGAMTPEAVSALDELEQRLQTTPLSSQPALADEVAALQHLSGLKAALRVTPSTLPIIGGLVTRLKQALHQLVLFYIQDLAAQQNAFNAQTVRVAQRLVEVASVAETDQAAQT